MVSTPVRTLFLSVSEVSAFHSTMTTWITVFGWPVVCSPALYPLTKTPYAIRRLTTIPASPSRCERIISLPYRLSSSSSLTLWSEQSYGQLLWRRIVGMCQRSLLAQRSKNCAIRSTAFDSTPFTEFRKAERVHGSDRFELARSQKCGPGLAMGTRHHAMTQIEIMFTPEWPITKIGWVISSKSQISDRACTQTDVSRWSRVTSGAECLEEKSACLSLSNKAKRST